MAEMFLSRMIRETMRLPHHLAEGIIAHFGRIGWRGLPRRLQSMEVELPPDIEESLGISLREHLGRMEGMGSINLVKRAGVEPDARRIILQRAGETEILFEKPYRLTEFTGVGFRNAHRIALVTGRSQVMPERISALITDVLLQMESHGDTCASAEQVLEAIRRSYPEEAAAIPSLPSLAEMLDDRFLLVTRNDEPALGRGRILTAELTIARRLAILSEQGSNPVLADDAMEGMLATESFRRLDAIQRAAVRMALREPVSIVTGGPGTGKSTIMEAVVAGYEQAGWDVLVAAPTGKAAKRLAETTERQATTLHRLLEAMPSGTGEFRFRRGGYNPLGNGAPVAVVVDEASMIDAELAAALFDAMPDKGRLVLVGDRDQLPSVGPGAVLRDLLASERVPSTALVNVYRQGKGSAVAAGAALLRKGRLPDLTSARAENGDLRFLPTRPDMIASRVASLVSEEVRKHGRAALERMAILSPQLNGPGGVNEINERLSHLLNPGGAQVTRHLAVGDRVILIRNDHERGLMNGELGTVQRAGLEGGFRVRFDGGESHDFDAEEASSFLRAYAITAHRSQGSQYDTVILVMHDQQRAMLDRSVLYTAWTRAKTKLLLVGEENAMRVAAARTRAAERQTMLADFCRTTVPERVLEFATSQDDRGGQHLPLASPSLDEAPCPANHPVAPARRLATSQTSRPECGDKLGKPTKPAWLAGGLFGKRRLGASNTDESVVDLIPRG
jgi:exodeoxyribonuclease V alpha subunit